MLEDLINEYIEAMHNAKLHGMLRIEKIINGLGMDSATLRTQVKEIDKQKVVS